MNSISVIMPVYNGKDYIVHSLPPLVEMLERGEISELVVVDDSSTDTTVEVATKMGARVIPSGGRLGPGAARNMAAKMAVGDILWFVDGDVVVHADAIHRLKEGLSRPGVVAVFGSYDDRPPAQNFFSQYKNLVHHYYHNQSNEEAATFWAGCGAVRKDAFLSVGGFDVDTYKRPSIEDIELGYRLKENGGRILLVPQLKSTHLKVWKLANLLHTEIFCRAIPWSRLMLRRTGLHSDLNVSFSERVRAALAGMLLMVLVLSVAGILPWWVVAIAGAVVLAANRDLFVLFVKRKGLWFGLRGILFHQVYYLYSTAAFVWCWVEARVFRMSNAVATG